MALLPVGRVMLAHTSSESDITVCIPFSFDLFCDVYESTFGVRVSGVELCDFAFLLFTCAQLSPGGILLRGYPILDSPYLSMMISPQWYLLTITGS